MGRFSEKVVRYLGGVSHGMRHFKPRYMLKLFSADDYTIRRTVYGFSMIVNVMDRTIGRPIALSGTYEKNVTLALLKLVKPDSRFLDIGANLGWFSLLVASRSPQGRVYSFEPDRRIFELLSANILLNGYGEIINAYNMAASDTDGELIVTDLGNPMNYGARFTGHSQEELAQYVHGPNPSSSKVKAVAIDSILSDITIDLVKADIEGFEPYAFRGMVRLIERCKPIILTEFAPSNLEKLGKTEPEAFLQFFIDKTYQVNVIDLQGNLVSCGSDAGQVMEYHRDHGGHHLDLVLKPQQSV